jgi:formylmethanofuran dehydrogenase subunit E
MATSTPRCAGCGKCFYIGVLRPYNDRLWCKQCWRYRKTPPKPREEKE